MNAVKRLFQGADALLSRPGRVLVCTSPIGAVCDDIQPAAKQF
jgi:hypothetical protein